MADYGDDNVDAFCVDSTIDFPSMNQSDPNPHGSLDSIPNAAFGGYGTGGETLMPDGSATTRWKAPNTTAAVGEVDGGAP